MIFLLPMLAGFGSVAASVTGILVSSAILGHIAADTVTTILNEKVIPKRDDL